MGKKNRLCPRAAVGWGELKGVLEVGDVLHFQGRGWLSGAVRFFSRGRKERASWASHSAMVLRVGEEIEIIEALWKTVIRPITAYKEKKSRLLVCRKPGGIDEEQKQRMVKKAEYYEGKLYGFWEIAFHALDRLVNNAYFFRRLIKDDDYPICSWLVAYVYDRVLGYRFGTSPNAAQPDDILDHCVDNDWEFVWADSKETVKNFCNIYDLQEK